MRTYDCISVSGNLSTITWGEGNLDAIPNVVVLLLYLFRAGERPQGPFPHCGLDSTPTA